MVKKRFYQLAIVLAYLFLVLLFVFWNEPILYLKRAMSQSSILGPLSYFMLTFVSVVFAPIATIPLVPVASIVFGSFYAAVLSILGWYAGSIVAFILARQAGKPLLRRLVSLEKIEKMENKIPEEAEFWWIVLLRIIIPVDILSYALGLLTKVSFRIYGTATLLGIMPMAFVFSYAGSAFFMGDFMLFIILAVVAILIVGTLSYVYYRNHKFKRSQG